MSMVPLMLVPLIVWIAVWFYLWNLDKKVTSLQRELARVADGLDTQE